MSSTSTPQVSPNGKWVVFERDRLDGTVASVIAGIDGKHERVLDLGCVDPCALISAPSWAPGRPPPRLHPDHRAVRPGQRLRPFGCPLHRASGRQPPAAVVARGHRRQSTRTTGRGLTRRKWLSFVRIRNSDVTAAIFVMRADGTHVHQVTPWSLHGDEADFSPAVHGTDRRPDRLRDVWPGSAARLPAGHRHGAVRLPPGLGLHEEDPLRHPQRRGAEDELQPRVVAWWTTDRLLRRGVQRDQPSRQASGPCGPTAATGGRSRTWRTSSSDPTGGDPGSRPGQRKRIGSNSSSGMIRIRGSGRLKASASCSRSSSSMPGELGQRGADELAERQQPHPAPASSKRLDLGQEVAVVAGEQHVALASRGWRRASA